MAHAAGHQRASNGATGTMMRACERARQRTTTYAREKTTHSKSGQGSVCDSGVLSVESTSHLIVFFFYN